MEYKKVNDDELKRFREENLMFITSPGRMGDIEGSTFVVKEDNELKMYYIENLYKCNTILNIFPEWVKSVKEDSKSNKYNYIYMGFGNGLHVDKSIYDEYYPYLLEEVKKDDMYYEEDNDNYNPCLNYAHWEHALENMINDTKKTKK